MLHPQGFLTGLCEEHASRPVEACTRHVGRRSVECDRSDAVIVDQARLLRAIDSAERRDDTIRAPTHNLPSVGAARDGNHGRNVTSTDDLLAGTRLEHPCGLVVTTHATREASARNETARTGAAIVRREISAPVATSITVPYRPHSLSQDDVRLH